MAKEHLKYESTEIDRRLDLAGTALQEHQDISHLATKEEVVGGLATKENVIEDLEKIRSGAALGATAIQEHQDISNLATKKEVSYGLAKKVDKVSGKQLSTEDYTTAEKTKLRGLYNYDDTTVKASIKTVEDKVKTKQDIISDLATIREGANKGATAIQEVKTINGESILGTGNIEIKGGGSSYDDTEIREQINSLQSTIPTKVSQLTNDSGYLTTHQDISHLATKDELKAKQDNIVDLATIRNGASLGATALQAVPSEYITEAILNNKGYLTSVPDEYVTETELNGKGYATTSELTSGLSEKASIAQVESMIAEAITNTLNTEV